MKNLKVLSGALVCVMVLGFAAIGQAAAYEEDGYGYPGYGVRLTPDQMDAARKIFKDNYAAMDETRQALAEKRAELNALLASPTPDRVRVESLSREIGELRGKMLANRVEVRNELEKNGLPGDFYAPNAAPRRGYYEGPEVWHHRGGHHGGPRGWRGGCGGCWW